MIKVFKIAGMEKKYEHQQDESHHVQKQIADHIRIIRLQKRISQFALSKDAGMSQAYYCELERGERNFSIGSLAKIAKALKVDLTTLIPDDLVL